MKFPSSSYWQMGLVPQELLGFTFVYGYYWTVYFRKYCDALFKSIHVRKELRTREVSSRIFVANYRVTVLVGENLPLTWILDVPPSCLSSKQLQ